jgi:hypothetical protein
LDSASALELLSVLCSLADLGHTVVMSVHQPRIEMWNLFHRVLFLASGGHIVYYGPPSQAPVQMANTLGGEYETLLRESSNPAHTILDILKSMSVGMRLAEHYKQFGYDPTVPIPIAMPPFESLQSPGAAGPQLKPEPALCTVNTADLPNYSSADKIFTLVNRGLSYHVSSHPIWVCNAIPFLHLH